MAGVMQSRLPIEHDGYGLKLPPSPPTLAEVLHDRGVSTLGLHSNTYTTAEYGFDRGFDVFADIFEKDNVDPTLGNAESDGLDFDKPQKQMMRMEHLRVAFNRLGLERPARRIYDELDRWGVVDNPSHARADELFEATVSWLESTEGPRFAWLQCMDTHSPFDPPSWARQEVDGANVSSRQIYDLNRRLFSEAETLTREEFGILKALYEAEIRSLDRELQKFIDVLHATGDWNSTALVVTSDHGELFGDRPIPWKEYSARHPQYLCDELTHVPLWLVGGAVGNETITELTSGIDLAPTIVDGFGITPPDEWIGTIIGSDAHLKRKRIVSALVHSESDSIAIDDSQLHVAVRDESYAVLWWRSDIETQVFKRREGTEHYLGTIDDVSATERERVTELLNIAQRYDENEYGVSEEGDVGGKVTQRLKDLGYVE